MSDENKNLIPMEFLEKYGHRAGDEFIKAENVKAGRTLCEHCTGTGNELYSMYRICPDCGGSGHDE